MREPKYRTGDKGHVTTISNSIKLLMIIKIFNINSDLVSHRGMQFFRCPSAMVS